MNMENPSPCSDSSMSQSSLQDCSNIAESSPEKNSQSGIPSVRDMKRSKAANNNKLMLQFKYSTAKKPYEVLDRGSRYGSKIIEFKKLAYMWLVFYLFFLYHKKFNEEMVTSAPHQLMKMLENKNSKKLNLTNVLADSNIKKKIDNMSFGNFITISEVNTSIEKWRAPDDDFMYSKYIKIIEDSVDLNKDEQLELKHEKMHESCDIARQKSKYGMRAEFYNCSIALFTGYKRIRQKIFEIQKANNCNECGNSLTNLTEFHKNGLFPNELCYCRNGNVKKYTNFKDYKDTCSIITEDCNTNCHPGYAYDDKYDKHGNDKENWIPCKKHVCICNNGTPVSTVNCIRHGAISCSKCKNGWYELMKVEPNRKECRLLGYG